MNIELLMLRGFFLSLKKKSNSTAYQDSHSICTSFCEIEEGGGGVKAGVQISKREIHTNIHLN